MIVRFSKGKYESVVDLAEPNSIIRWRWINLDLLQALATIEGFENFVNSDKNRG